MSRMFLLVAGTVMIGGMAVLLGLLPSGREIMTQCVPAMEQFNSDHRWVFGFPFPTIVQNLYTTECDGEDDYGYYLPSFPGALFDMLIWGGLEGSFVYAVMIFTKDRY